MIVNIGQRLAAPPSFSVFLFFFGERTLFVVFLPAQWLWQAQSITLFTQGTIVLKRDFGIS